MSQDSTDGGGQHGFLGLALPTAEYVTFSAGNVPYIAPVVQPPVIPTGASIITINEANRLHREAKKAVERHHDMDKALLRQVIEVIPDVYLASLKHRKLGYATVTTLAALQHLRAQFGTVTDKDMNSNIDRIEKP